MQFVLNERCDGGGREEVCLVESLELESKMTV